MAARTGSRWVSAPRMNALLTLLEEAREIGADVQARRTHLVAGVHRLLGAAFVATVVDDDFHPAGRGRLREVAAHGLDGASSQVLTVLAEQGTAFHPALRRSMVSDRYEHATVWDRRQKLDDRAWARDPYVVDYVRPHRLDPCILGGARLGERALLGVGAMRERGDRPFTDEDAALLEGYAHGVRRLWQAAPADAPLPPRLARLHAAMLTGASEKQIAARLQLSWHSVHTYARDLYRRLGVSSRAELMARARR